MLRKTMFALMVMFCVSSYEYAEGAPSISSTSGEFSEGHMPTILGSNFGVKPNPNPLVFDNFDSNDAGRQNGDTIKGKKASHYGSWRNQSINYAPIYSGFGNRAGSVLCSQHYMVGVSGQNHAPLWNDFSDSNISTILVSLWTRFTFTTTVSSFQFKYWRLTNGLGDQDGNANFQNGWWNSRVPGKKGMFQFFLESYGSPYWPNWSIKQGYNDVNLDYNKKEDGDWHNYIVFIRQGGSAENNGSVIIFVDGERVGYETAMITWDGETFLKSITLGWYLGNNSDGASTYGTLYFDDVYVDNTWQSVWVGDDSAWDNCTHREIQIPIRWTTDSISIDFNQGAFQSGKAAYLYVVDSNGNVNSTGYPIIIGGKGQPAPSPAAPSGLTVIK